MERERPEEVSRVDTLASDDVLRMPEIGIDIPITEFYVDIERSTSGPVFPAA